jgi:arylsulfatase A-like enzyme
LLLATLLLACSDGPRGSAGTPALARPPLQRVTPRERRTLALVERLQPPAELAGWTVDAAEPRLVERAGERRLVLAAGGRSVITIPRRVDPEEVNQVVVRGEFRKLHAVGLRLVRDDGRAVKLKPMAAARRAGEQSVLFDLTGMRQAQKAFDALEVSLDGPAPGVELLSIDLLNKPIEHYLPDPESGGGVASILTESRHAVGLLRGDPLEARFTVLDPGQELLFACALVPELRVNGARPRVVVTVTGGGRTLEREVLLEDEREEVSRWHDAALPLAEFAGADVRAQFVFLTDRDRPAVCALAGPTLVRRDAAPPTVLLVTSDTHRADHVGLARAGVAIDTPALDALAARGVLFEDAYSSTNVTSPSHVALFTGVHPRETRLVSNTGHIGAHARTLAEAFREAGWATAAVVSVRHLGGRGTGLGQGFDRIVDPPGGPWPAAEPVEVARSAVDGAAGLPLFVWLHLFDAHEPYAPPAPFDQRYYPEDRDPFDPALPPVTHKVLPAALSKVRDLEYPLAQYRGEITYLDAQLASLFEHPRVARGWVCMTSDHGEVLVSGERYFNHGYVSPHTLHVPLILAGPDVPAGARCALPVRQLDVGRTLLDLAGLGHAPFPGRNLLLALDGAAPAETARFALSAHGNSASVQRGKWFCALSLREHVGGRFEEVPAHVTELYDLERDPSCELDLAETERATAAALRAELVAWLGAPAAPDLTVEGGRSAEEVAELAALGYAPEVEERGPEAWFDASCTCARCAEWR